MVSKREIAPGINPLIIVYRTCSWAEELCCVYPRYHSQALSGDVGDGCLPDLVIYQIFVVASLEHDGMISRILVKINQWVKFGKVYW